MKVSSCLKSMRLRTLPLSLSGVLLGIYSAATIEGANVFTIIFLVLTASLLQILSNLSNELGDNLHGTDTSERQGMHYSIQDGEMTVSDMKTMVKITALMCCISGLLMIYFSFGTLFSLKSIVFVLLGAAAVAAALRYTLGHNPYGYRGLGDLFVFIFFGLVSTLGSFYICCHSIVDIPIALPSACAVGFFSMAVLNLNNIRDMKTDEKTRTTVAIKLGPKKARIYQTCLISLGWISLLAGYLFGITKKFNPLFLIILPLFIIHIKDVWTKDGKDLDPLLPELVINTFLLSIMYGITL